MEKYKVICQKCGGNDQLTITEDKTVFYKNHIPIISARYRPDQHWGFECQCGNDSRVAVEEKAALPMLVRGGEHSIARIAKTLAKGSEQRFLMEKI